MSVLTRLFPENPVLIKELRVRMRGARAYWILLGYLGFLSIILLFTYYNWQSDVSVTKAGASDASRMGVQIYMTLLICQSFLVLFITPAITSGSITIEKEQQTLDMLTMTRLPRSSVITGKMLSAISFTALLLISSLPLISISFMLGGVDLEMVISTYAAMLAGSCLIGGVGIMWSSVAKTTTIAVMLTYLSMLLFAVVMACAIGSHYGVKNSPVGIPGNVIAYSFISLIETWCSGDMVGRPNIEYVGFSVLSILIAVLMATIATVRLETWPERRAVLLRGLTAAITLFQFVACIVWWLGRLYGVQTIKMATVPAIGALTIPILIMMLIVPIFATGELAPREARRFGRYLLWGWTPKGLMRAKLASGLPFLVLLTMLFVGTFALAFVAFGKSGDLSRSALLPGSSVSAVTPTPPPAPNPPVTGYTGTINTNGTTTVYQNGTIVSINGQPVVQPTAPGPPPVVRKTSHAFWETTGDFAQAVIVLFTFVIGYSLFCQSLSIAFGSRWIAVGLAFIVMMMIVILPVMAIGIGTSSNEQPWAIVNLIYLNPLYCFVEMTETNFTWPVANLIFGPAPAWLITSAAWTLLGSASFLATLPFVVRTAMKTDAIPYEEMVATV